MCSPLKEHLSLFLSPVSFPQLWSIREPLIIFSDLTALKNTHILIGQYWINVTSVTISVIVI